MMKSTTTDRKEPNPRIADWKKRVVREANPEGFFDEVTLVFKNAALHGKKGDVWFTSGSIGGLFKDKVDADLSASVWNSNYYAFVLEQEGGYRKWASIKHRQLLDIDALELILYSHETITPQPLHSPVFIFEGVEWPW